MKTALRVLGSSVPTNTLKIGDTILSHGCVMRVREIIVSKSHDSTTDQYGVCHANICDYLGLHPTVASSPMPMSWRRGWNEQGNSLGRSFLLSADDVFFRPEKRSIALRPSQYALTPSSARELVPAGEKVPPTAGNGGGATPVYGYVVRFADGTYMGAIEGSGMFFAESRVDAWIRPSQIIATKDAIALAPFAGFTIEHADGTK